MNKEDIWQLTLFVGGIIVFTIGSILLNTYYHHIFNILFYLAIMATGIYYMKTAKVQK